MIDPHGEYSAAFKGIGELFNVDNLADALLADELRGALRGLPHLHRRRAPAGHGHPRQMPAPGARARTAPPKGMAKLTVDSPIPYLLSDLTNAIARRDGHAQQGDRHRAVHAAQDQDRRAQGRSALSVHVLGHARRRHDGQLHRQDLPPARAAASRSRSSTSRACRRTSSRSVVAVLSRLVFDYAIWSRSEVPRPVLLVCEEAHRYIPSDKTSTGQAVRKILERIAKEGRKYGVSLGLITQRPSDLAEGVLSQCGTIIAMRLNNDRDQASSSRRCPKARAASSTSSRRFATANASSAARACRSRSASPSTISSATAAGLVRSALLRAVAPVRARRKRWSAASSSAGAARDGRSPLAFPLRSS